MKRVCMSIMLKKFLFIGLFVLIINLTGCTENTTFSGSKTSNDNQFLVEFDVLNTTVNSKMHLSEGDTIESTINIKKGILNIIVENENGTIAYRSNDVESGNFIIEIKEAGTYTFYITGLKAEGNVYFIKS